ncbi:MAG: hypothetical protein ACRD35_07600 [Candidatus Acidiferrales bacterium]
MNLKKYLLATLAVYVLYSGLAIVIHEIILKADYEPMIGSVTRPLSEFGQRAPLLYLANLVFALAFCYIYVQGYEAEKSWLGQGLRFGLIAGTLLAPFAVTEWVIYPVPWLLCLKWIVFGYLQVLICGVAAAALYTAPPRRY